MPESIEGEIVRLKNLRSQYAAEKEYINPPVDIYEEGFREEPTKFVDMLQSNLKDLLLQHHRQFLCLPLI